LADAAFELLLLSHLDAAYGVALKLSRQPDEAEALVQEASLRALRAWATFVPGTNFKAWYLRVLTNCFFEQCRKNKRGPVQSWPEEDLELYLFTRTDAAEEFLSRFELGQVQEAFAQLPEEFRVVAALYFQRDLAYQEIAEILELPLGTVRSRIYRARRLLQKALWEVALEHGIRTRPGSDPRGVIGGGA
jgi:RNA polymerase sigma-70 factor, ECF subfamily